MSEVIVDINVLNIKGNGIIQAPALTIAEIDSDTAYTGGGAKCLTTREYVIEKVGLAASIAGGATNTVFVNSAPSTPGWTKITVDNCNPGFINQYLTTGSSPTFANVSSSTPPTASSHLTTKNYVDTLVNQAAIGSNPTFSTATANTFYISGSASNVELANHALDTFNLQPVTLDTWNSDSAYMNFGGILVG